MKKIIFILVTLCMILNINAQEGISEKPVWFNTGIGTSIRMGTLLFPSVDAFVDFGPITFEGYYKYVDHSEKSLNIFGASANLHFLKLGYNSSIFVSYSYSMNSEWNNSENSSEITDENIFCIGLQGKINNHLRILFKLGTAVAVKKNFQDKIDPRIEIGFQIPIRKLDYRQVFFFNLK